MGALAGAGLRQLNAAARAGADKADNSPGDLMPSRNGPSALWPTLLAALLLPLVLTALLHGLSLRPWAAAADRALMRLADAQRVADAGLHPPPPEAPGRDVRLPLFEAALADAAPGPLWLRARFALPQAADTTWALSLGHRTPVLVYLDGRLLANSVPVTEADEPPRNLQIGERRLSVSVPADWLGAGAHEIAVRLGAPGPAGTSLSALVLGPAPAVEAADRPRRFWLALRVVTALAALVIGTLLLFVWLVERREALYLGSALHLLMLALLLTPYALSEPLLPAPLWRMLLDAADVLAKGLAPLIILAWAGTPLPWVRRVALAYIALALPVDALAAYHGVTWTDFTHPWPWWALASRAAILALAAFVALRALAARPDLRHFGTALLAGLALWVWADVSVFALVLRGLLPVVDLNVVVYAGWALWVALLLHRRLVHERRREQQLRDELAGRLAERTRSLHEQFEALKASESARLAAAERERLLQEMHDGLGAQLTTTKMLASEGRISHSEMVDALDACLREMRLTVDALSVTDGDVGLLLAALRQRLEPGLRAAGIVLEWQVAETPVLPVLAGTGGRELARIVQEALANVMHHAEASRVVVSTRLTDDGGRLQIVLADDGRGLPAELKPGRGLRNMRQRIARLAGSIQWRRPAPPSRGTELVIELPLGVPTSESEGETGRGASERGG
jgi:signal transduction histidine kinase